MANNVGKLMQSGKTNVITPKVKLVTYTRNPIGTIFVVWHGSRSDQMLNAEVVQKLYDSTIFDEEWYDRATNDEGLQNKFYRTAKIIIERYTEHTGKSGKDFKNAIFQVAKAVAGYDIPVNEAINFTFSVKSANVAWREQKARSKFDQFWTQSSRIMDLRTMEVTMNPSIGILGGKEAIKVYKDAVDTIRDAYCKLIDLGVPAEDIRLQPQSHTENLYWFVSLRTLLTIISKRSDWIAQASLWTPIIAGVIKCLREIGLYELVKDKIGKPMCEIGYHSDYEQYYVLNYQNIPDCEDRMRGIDTLPIDPLYLAYANKTMPDHTDLQYYDYMKSMFIQIWDDKILEILGWDRSDPSKLGPYDRPVNKL